ncbi:hypothetical protein Y032_0623g769 [Ancylostoma ceylanicum]|uniref:Uncharacterized protein n=1 Tax=Ancylostoma ceylanicum TaxID=53326 RepID=A0A016WLR6_9BILA|nr:hypothetical protein Y032_0623g769 [Ancylostoma ceylanicum]
MHIDPKNPQYRYFMKGAHLDDADEISDLRFLVRKDLNFDAQCEKIASLATRRVYALFRALSSTDSATLLNAFKTYVRPILECGTVIFNPHRRKAVMLLEKVQSSFTRKLLMRTTGGFRYDQIPCSNTRNFNLGQSSLAERRGKFDLIMIHKILYGYTDLKQEVLFNTRESVTRGTSRKLLLKRAS